MVDADEVAPLLDRSEERDELRRAMDAFLANGGKVRKVRQGVTAEHDPREERDKRIRKMYEAGVRQPEIAAKEGVGLKTITNAVRGMPRHRDPDMLLRHRTAWRLREEGVPAAAIAERLGVKLSTVYAMYNSEAKRRGVPMVNAKRYKAERNSVVFDEYVEGIPVAEIAERHGFHKSLIIRLVDREARRRGVEAPRRGQGRLRGLRPPEG